MAELKLQYADGFDETKSMSTTGQFSVVLTSDGISYDLSQATDIAIKVGNAEGYVSDIPVDLNAIDDKAQGTVNIKLDDNFMAQFPPDVYYIEVWVGTDKGRIIFPSSGVLPFTIDNNIMSNVNGVAKITMYQFQNNFNDLKKMIMNNQAFLDTTLKETYDRAEQLRNDYQHMTDTKASQFNQIINDYSNQTKRGIDNKTNDAKQHIDNKANSSLDTINSQTNNTLEKIDKYVTDSKNNFQDFSDARKKEINNRITELQNSVNNLNTNVKNHEQSYNNLNNEAQTLLNQLKDNQKNIPASLEEVNNARDEFQNKADNAQANAIKQSGQYIDNKYNELNNKSDNLSNQLSDYQQQNLVDFSSDDWINTGKNSSHTMIQSNDIHLQKDKSYWFSIEYKDGNWRDNPSIMVYKNGWDTFNKDYWCIGYDKDHNKTNLNPYYQYIPKQDEDIQIRIVRWNDVLDDILIRRFTITQTETPITYEVAEKNKKIINNASKTYVDTQDKSILDKTNILEDKIDKKNNAIGDNDTQIDRAYQNSVNTSKRYVNNQLKNIVKKQNEHNQNHNDLSNQLSNTKRQMISLDSDITNKMENLQNDVTQIKFLKDRDSAIQEAKFSKQPLLCVYPNGFQDSKAIEISAIYSFGNIPPNKYVNIEGIIEDGDSLKGKNRQGVYLVLKGSTINDAPFNSSDDYLINYSTSDDYSWVDAMAWKNGEYYNQQQVGESYVKDKKWTYGKYPQNFDRGNLNYWNPKDNINSQYL